MTDTALAPTVVRHDGTQCKAPHPAHWERRMVTVQDAEGDPIQGVCTTPIVLCTRLSGHYGDHAGYVFSIRAPETWSNTTEDNTTDR